METDDISIDSTLDLDREYILAIQTPLARALAMTEVVWLAVQAPDSPPVAIAETLLGVWECIAQALGDLRPVSMALELQGHGRS